jgi:hypothetical protein
MLSGLSTLFDAGDIITIAAFIIGGSVTWGKFSQKINNLESQRGTCEKRFEGIEHDHSTNVRELREEVKSISAQLHEMMGMLKMFLSIKEPL